MIKFAKTEYGVVEGITGWDPAVRVFRGIPYAAPPVGELRWRPPQPPKPWDGVLKAFEFPNICFQRPDTIKAEVNSEFDEDCLYLNVWTCAEETGEKRPVLVYVHGGGYNMGCGHYHSYDGEAMAKQGIVMVTFNYRLNLFGYMCHPELKAESEHNACGNYGLLDQIEVLKWVHNNIAAFGGDPDNVTVMGLSAGAGSTRALCDSPLTKGLITRAATLSVGGHIKSPDYITTDGLPDEECYSDLKELFGVSTIAEARALSGEELYGRFLERTKHLPFHAVFFRPVVDGYSIPDTMWNIQESGRHADIQYMIGHSADEMMLPNMANKDEEKIRAEGAKVYEGEALEKYVALKMADETEDYKKAGYSLGAEHSRAAALGFCQLQLDLGRKPVYNYIMSRKVPGDPKGSFHGSDLYYHFKTMSRSWQDWNGDDFELANITSRMWANYIKTGDPNGPGLPYWAPYTDENPYTLVIDAKKTSMQVVEDTPLVKFLTEYTRNVKHQGK